MRNVNPLTLTLITTVVALVAGFGSGFIDASRHAADTIDAWEVAPARWDAAIESLGIDPLTGQAARLTCYVKMCTHDCSQCFWILGSDYNIFVTQRMNYGFRCPQVCGDGWYTYFNVVELGFDCEERPVWVRERRDVNDRIIMNCTNDPDFPLNCTQVVVTSEDDEICWSENPYVWQMRCYPNDPCDV